jgi:formylglycine-generating enzyme required for sulfatase activity
MGSPASEQDRAGNEGPQTQVMISKAFLIGKYEVTQREYLKLMGYNPSQFTGDLDRPVDMVDWDNAMSYCEKLTAQERAAGRLPAGWEYRLPTEAQWEYACRAGTTSRFNFGNDPFYFELGTYAWYSDNSGKITHPVGTRSPNSWGLYDMYGNVWEWCSDLYTDSLPGGSVTNPQGPSSGSNRVVRGGRFDYGPHWCRSAARYGLHPDSRYEVIGFRVAIVYVP